MQYIDLWIDHPKIGCGRRHFLVLKEGRTLVKLLSTGTMETITVPKAILARAIPVTIKPSRLARRMRATAETYDRAALERAIAAGREKGFSWPHRRLAREAAKMLRVTEPG